MAGFGFDAGVYALAFDYVVNRLNLVKIIINDQIKLVDDIIESL